MEQLDKSSSLKAYMVGIAAGMLLVYGGILAAYAGLAFLRPGSLPAPAITRLVPLDEKLRFLRRNPKIQPNILAVGSSITWRQIAGEAFDGPTNGAGGFLNGATGYLRIHQTRDLLDFYLDHFSGVNTVLLMTGPPDFEKCSEEPAVMLDHGDAAAYAFDRAPDVYFYIRYFSPQRYLRSVATLERESQPYIGGLFLDQYGSSPLEIPESMLPGLRYGAIERDPTCVTALSKLAADVTRRDLQLAVVFPPIHPDYRQQYPEVLDWLSKTAADLRTKAPRDHVQVVWLADDDTYIAEDFFDAFHLQWPAVRRLSRDVARSLRLGEQTAVKPSSSSGEQSGEKAEPLL